MKNLFAIRNTLICVTDEFSYFTKGKEYEVLGITSDSFEVIDDYGETLHANIAFYKHGFKLKEEKESVNHPSHYGGENNPLEVINIIEHYDLNFNLGNVIKYCLRAGKKDELIQELKKAQWYINREIQRLEK